MGSDLELRLRHLPGPPGTTTTIQRQESIPNPVLRSIGKDRIGKKNRGPTCYRILVIKFHHHEEHLNDTA